jgi:hypothetical protein
MARLFARLPPAWLPPGQHRRAGRPAETRSDRSAPDQRRRLSWPSCGPRSLARARRPDRPCLYGLIWSREDRAPRLGAAALGLYRLLARSLLLYGRRRFVLLLLLGAAIGQGWTLVWPGLFAAPFDLRVIGWVIPGLLANNLQRQKFWPTLASLAAASVLSWGAVKLLGMVF